MFFLPITVSSQPWSTPNMEEVCKVVKCEVSIEDKINLAFPDEPKMVDIAWCESRHRQLVNGKPLISRTYDVGVMQINQVHWKQAKELGLDIFYNIDDNLKMARIIYDRQSITAWYALKSECYKNLVSGVRT